VGVNLAAKDTFDEEMGPLLTGTKIDLFEFWRYMFQF